MWPASAADASCGCHEMPRQCYAAAGRCLAALAASAEALRAGEVRRANLQSAEDACLRMAALAALQPALGSVLGPVLARSIAGTLVAAPSTGKAGAARDTALAAAPAPVQAVPEEVTALRQGLAAQLALRSLQVSPARAALLLGHPDSAALHNPLPAPQAQLLASITCVHCPNDVCMHTCKGAPDPQAHISPAEVHNGCRRCRSRWTAWSHLPPAWLQGMWACFVGPPAAARRLCGGRCWAASRGRAGR